MKLTWRSNKVFFLFVLVSLLVSILVSVFMVGKRADSILLSTQTNASNYEASYAIANIHQFIDNRYRILRDIARSPWVVNSVMGSDMERVNMVDYLNDRTIIGEKERLEVINILGDIIYGEQENPQPKNYQKEIWFEKMLSGELDVYISIEPEANRHFFTITTPIIYNDFVEGVLKAQFSASLEQQFATSLKPEHAIRISTGTSSYESFQSEQDYVLISQVALTDTNLIVEYFIKQAHLNQEKQGFMRDIALSIVISLVLSFSILAVLGQRYIVNPFKQLYRQEKKVRASEERFQLAVEGSKDGIWDWDIERDVIYFSPRFFEILGYSNEGDGTITSMEQWLDLVHPVDRENVREALNHHLDGNSDFDIEYQLKKQCGSYGVFRVKGFALYGEDAKPIRMAGSLTDITEDRIAELALAEARKQNELLAHAIEASPIGISIADAKKDDLPLSYVNDGFLKMTGYQREEVLGKNCRFLQGPNTDNDVLNGFRRAIKNRNPHVDEMINYRKDGSTFWNSLHLSPIYDENNRLIAYVGVQKDITERKAFENELQLSRIEAESANQTKSNFLASMSHEIRTPMNGVIGMLNLLCNEPLTPNQRQKIRIATNSAQSLLSLINDVLDFSKIEVGKLDLEEIEFNLIELFEDGVESASILVQDKPLELIVDTCEIEHPVAIGDPNRIRQVITNILSNAVKFTAKGEVTVTTRTSLSAHNHLCLQCTVTDTGIGIPADKIDSLFESFTQADASTTRQFGGTGLGLAIVKKLCNMMQGDVVATSEPGQGSCFQFWLRLELPEESFEKRGDSDEYTGKRVLVLDCFTSTRTALCRAIAAKGLKVVQSKSAEHLFTLLATYQKNENQPFDVFMISDNVEEVNSEDFYSKIKTFPCVASTSLILSTKHVDQNILNDYLRFGFVGYVHRPITTRDLTGAMITAQNWVDELNSDLVNVRTAIDSKELSAISNRSKIAESTFEAKLLLVEDNEINQVVALSLLNKIGFKDIVIAGNGAVALETLSERGNNSAFDLILMDCQMPELDGYETSRLIRKGQAGELYKGITIVAMTANAMRGDEQKCLAAGMSDYITKPVDEEELRKTLIRWLGQEEPH